MVENKRHEQWAKIHFSIDSTVKNVLSRPRFEISISNAIETIRTISRYAHWRNDAYMISLYAHPGYSLLKVYAIHGYEERDDVFFSSKFEYSQMVNVRKTIITLANKIRNRPFHDIYSD